jgi:hypothetical protein
MREEKNKILLEVDKGRKQIQLTRMIDIEPMILSMILKDWDTIFKLYECYAICPGGKRLWLGDYSKVEETINTWFR